MLLTQKFFSKSTLQVAQNLLGKKLVFKGKEGIITETEAYIGKDDPACHAACGLTKRNAVMFGEPGFSYVYFIYGMYYCLNIVTEQAGFPAAVLIRGVIDVDSGVHYDGPGKLCRFFGITKEQSGLDLINSADFFISETGIKFTFIKTPRIGIKKGKELPWRFVAVKPRLLK